MTKRYSVPVPPEDLIAYIDGEASPEIAERIAADPQQLVEARGYARVQEVLQQRLHRFDCPSSQTLGEYELGMLVPAERTRVARHVVECPQCTAELVTLRAFMSVDDAPPLGAVERVRRLVATFVPAPRGAVAGLRGAADESARTYHAGDLTITLDVGAVRRGRASLIGLIWREDGAVMPPGSVVTMTGTTGIVASAEVDDLGNFAFDDVEAGTWQVELALGDEIVVIDGLHIGA
jgi:anti-sigma factor RsiW